MLFDAAPSRRIIARAAMHTRLTRALAAHACTDAAVVGSAVAAPPTPPARSPHHSSSTTCTCTRTDEAADDATPRLAPVQRLLSSGRVEDVAPCLLGAVLHNNDVSVRLTEVEAYGNEVDPGSHAARGRTARNAVMFGPPGHLYVYLIYGMHCCANIVVGQEGRAGAVLVRAGAVVRGAEIARSRRPGVKHHELARGPACLCKALGIDRSHDGADIAGHGGHACADVRAAGAASEPGCSDSASGEHGSQSPPESPHAAPGTNTGPWLQLPARRSQVVRRGPRVGLRQAADWPWRFWLPEEPSVSAYRPAAPLKKRRRSDDA